MADNQLDRIVAGAVPLRGGPLESLAASPKAGHLENAQAQRVNERPVHTGLAVRGAMTRQMGNRMKELVRTNDAVYLSWAQAILTAEGIETFLLDANMANVEGSLGVLPRRLMVAEENFARANRF